MNLVRLILFAVYRWTIRSWTWDKLQKWGCPHLRVSRMGKPINHPTVDRGHIWGFLTIIPKSPWVSILRFHEFDPNFTNFGWFWAPILTSKWIYMGPLLRPLFPGRPWCGCRDRDGAGGDGTKKPCQVRERVKKSIEFPQNLNISPCYPTVIPLLTYFTHSHNDPKMIP